jgi:lipid II:glycine glycyltransferase (peptidoglycan interpeptide bridge formation enzyme)
MTGAATALRPAPEWRRLAGGFRDYNYRQCWDYAEAMARRAGAQPEHVSIVADGRPIGLASVRVKRIPGAGTGIAYVSGGPLVRGAADESPGERLDAVLRELVREYVHERRLVLRVAPAIGDADWNLEQERRFRAAGFAVAEHQRRYNTILVDLERPLEEVRAGFAKKWRYHLGRAEKAGITVDQGTDPHLFDDFVSLFDEFVTRKSFEVDLGADFYAGLQASLPETDRLEVAIARLGGEPVAGVVASLMGDTAVYLLGASNEAGREANAPYLLQWNVMEAVAARGLRWYDLGGIDPDGNPGVYRFKARMGGSELAAPGPFEIAPGGLRGGVVRTAERLVRAARQARAR